MEALLDFLSNIAASAEDTFDDDGNAVSKLIAAIEYLISLLLISNKDTLKALLGCLPNVAASTEDTLDDDRNMCK